MNDPSFQSNMVWKKVETKGWKEREADTNKFIETSSNIYSVSLQLSLSLSLSSHSKRITCQQYEQAASHTYALKAQTRSRRKVVGTATLDVMVASPFFFKKGGEKEGKKG